MSKVSDADLARKLDRDAPTPPLVCSLPAGEFRERRAQIQSFLDLTSTAIKALPDGVELKLAASPEAAHALIDFILFERVCCSSVTYELRSEPDHSSLTLRLSGPPKVVESLRSIYLAQ